jgi:amino acid transporter
MADIAAASAPSPDAAQNHHLSRSLNLRDLVLAQVLCVVGSSWVGIAAGLGRAQALVWITAMLLFYLPMAAAAFYLNREMPLEGGLYVWARRAFGDRIGFLTAWNIWAYALCVGAAILYAFPTEFSYLIGPAAAWLPESTAARLLIPLAILGLLTAASLRGLELGRWIHGVSGTAMIAVFAVLILTPLVSLALHRPIHWAPLAVALPHWNTYTVALMGQMFGALCGLEYVALMAGEARAPMRNISLSVVIASPVICAMFILGTCAVLAYHEAHPAMPVDFIAPIPQTMRLAFGETGFGSVCAMAAILLVQCRLLGAVSLLFSGATRLPMTAGWDHLVPPWFARLSPRRHVPVNSIWFSSAVVAAFIVLASIGAAAREAYQVLGNASVQFYMLSYVAMFAIPLGGPQNLRRGIPVWVRLTAVSGIAFTLFCFVMTAFPFVDVVNARTYAAKILGCTLVVNLLGWAFYALRSPRHRS